jgi:hypothetical protein
MRTKEEISRALFQCGIMNHGYEKGDTLVLHGRFLAKDAFEAKFEVHVTKKSCESAFDVTILDARKVDGDVLPFVKEHATVEDYEIPNRDMPSDYFPILRIGRNIFTIHNVQKVNQVATPPKKSFWNRFTSRFSRWRFWGGRRTLRKLRLAKGRV